MDFIILIMMVRLELVGSLGALELSQGLLSILSIILRSMMLPDSLIMIG